jgi:hypothetical protein
VADDIDRLRGLPQTRHNALTPLGEIEQAGKLTGAVRSQTGWRRTVARTGVVLVLLAIAIPFVAWAISSR